MFQLSSPAKKPKLVTSCKLTRHPLGIHFNAIRVSDLEDKGQDCSICASALVEPGMYDDDDDDDNGQGISEPKFKAEDFEVIMSLIFKTFKNSFLN